jgi:hypothetical protein
VDFFCWRCRHAYWKKRRFKAIDACCALNQRIYRLFFIFPTSNRNCVWKW